jgi:hypothetical protein
MNEFEERDPVIRLDQTVHRLDTIIYQLSQLIILARGIGVMLAVVSFFVLLHMIAILIK